MNPHVFVLAPPGPERERILQLLPSELEPRATDRVEDILESRDEEAETIQSLARERPPGVVLLAPTLAGRVALEALHALGRMVGAWVPLLLEEDGEGGLRARPVSVGPGGPVGELVARALEPDGDLPVLELGTVLRVVARARHDINNPLTAAMAETQLLLMDVQEPELRESVEMIRDQLDRIKNLVAELRSLKQARS